LCTFNVIAKNKHGHPINHGGHPIASEVFDKVGNEIPTKVIDNQDGTYTVNYQPVDPGDHRVEVFLRTKYPLFYDHIKDSPYFVPIVPGTDAAHSLVWGPGLEEVYDTKPAEFFIKARDREGNDMGKGGDPFEVHVVGPEGTDIPANVADNNDGTYTVNYAPTDHGKHTVYVTLKNNAVAKSPYTVNVLEGADYHSTFIEKFQFTIRSKTKGGNFKTVGGETFNISINGPHGAIASELIDTHDNKDGTYTVNYSLPTPGDYKISVNLNDHHIQGSPYPHGRPN